MPVTGFAWFYPEELEVINHPAFQRLGRINQLGQAHLVFRGATHKRVEHVLGVVGVIQRMISAVQFNSEKAQVRNRTGLSAPLSASEQRFVRLGALLHDIGHIAAGHTIEDELELIGKHDADPRLQVIFDKADWDGTQIRGVRTLREVIDGEYTKCVPAKLADKGISAAQIVQLLIRKRPAENDPLAKAQAELDQSGEIRYHVCSNMIGNTICADLLDYIYRDWYHVGRPRSAEDRIYQYMEIRRRGQIVPMLPIATPRPHPDDRFVISLGEKTKIRTDGVSAILGLLEWRYELAETVLFHRTKTAAGAMLDRALYELWEDKNEQDLVDKLLPVSDDQLLDNAIQEAEALKITQPEDEAKLEAAASLLRKLRDRALFKELATFDASNIAPTHVDPIKKSYAGIGAATKNGARCRTQTARLLESDFDLPAGSIAIYCSHIRPKIAEVSINVDGDISTFSQYEKTHDNRLSGGHLEAQIKRFERLWRIYFFIDPQVKAALAKDRLLVLQQTIAQVVLSVDEPEKLFQLAKEKALAYVQQEIKKGNNAIEFSDDIRTAARGDPGVAKPRDYPNGAPSIRTFIRQRS